MKGTKKYMEVILVVFLKKILIGQVGHFGPENGVTWIYSEDFFEILHSKRCKEVHENYFISFSEIFWANGPFWAQKWCNIIILVALKNYFSLAQ